MTITITLVTESGQETCKFVFDNSVDANKERDLFDAAGINYTVKWDCKPA